MYGTLVAAALIYGGIVTLDAVNLQTDLAYFQRTEQSSVTH
jgi:hypothetical protein